VDLATEIAVVYLDATSELPVGLAQRHHFHDLVLEQPDGGRGHAQAWPNAEPPGQVSDDRIDTPLGLVQDGKGVLWVIDMGLNIGKTRLWAFDIAAGKLLRKIELPAEVAPKGAFVQDLAVDAERGWAYLADIEPPGLIALNLVTGQAHRFGSHASLLPEPEAKLRVGGVDNLFGGKPASIGADPITLSADGATVFYGAMSGTHWYALPTKLLREGAGNARIASAVRAVGRKPISDGASTDAAGNHYFTNLNDNGLDMLDTRGRLRALVRDARIQWPDSVQIGPQGWLYLAVNQLHLTSAFAGSEQGRPPYTVLRVKAPGVNPRARP
jgi:sugar lactone lactonase YvrE